MDPSLTIWYTSLPEGGEDPLSVRTCSKNVTDLAKLGGYCHIPIPAVRCGSEQLSTLTVLGDGQGRKEEFYTTKTTALHSSTAN